ncbi:MAG: hypothetical protein V2B19_09815 [Pseudomonadota bacterium]
MSIILCNKFVGNNFVVSIPKPIPLQLRVNDVAILDRIRQYPELAQFWAGTGHDGRRFALCDYRNNAVEAFYQSGRATGGSGIVVPASAAPERS